MASDNSPGNSRAGGAGDSTLGRTGGGEVEEKGGEVKKVKLTLFLASKNCFLNTWM